MLREIKYTLSILSANSKAGLVHGGNKSRQADKIPNVYLIKRYFKKRRDRRTVPLSQVVSNRPPVPVRTVPLSQSVKVAVADESV